MIVLEFNIAFERIKYIEESDKKINNKSTEVSLKVLHAVPFVPPQLLSVT